MKKTILVILIALTISSCTDSKKENIATEPKDELIIKMNIKSNKKINISLTLSDIKVDEFQKKTISIVEKIVTPNKFENLTANFGKKNISNNLKINFGNLTTKVIEIESMNISYGKNVVEINPNNLNDYFVFSKFVSQNKSNHKLITKKVDGKHAPVITLKKTVFKKLKKQ